MAFNTVPTVAIGDIWTASSHNTYIRDNFTALWPGTAAGDLDYYSSPTTKARVPKGTAYQLLRMNAGATAPEWGAAAKVMGAKVQRNATQPITSSASTLITFDAEVYDSGSVWTAGALASRLYAPTLGYYILMASVAWEVNATGSRQISIRYQGTTSLVFDSRPACDGLYTQQTVGIFAVMDAGQYVDLIVWQNSGVSLNTAAYEARLSMALIGTY